jgi:hypothetical protein
MEESVIMRRKRWEVGVRDERVSRGVTPEMHFVNVFRDLKSPNTHLERPKCLRVSQRDSGSGSDIYLRLPVSTIKVRSSHHSSRGTYGHRCITRIRISWSISVS